MAANKDWPPSSRTEQLSMARNWYDILQNNGATWNIPKGIAGDSRKTAYFAVKIEDEGRRGRGGR